MSNPSLSVITVVYNGARFLAQTIESVINQTYHNIEYIIIDGASDDGSVEIIKRYDDSIDYWASEPDKGIAHAMNKGIRASSGDYLLFLHADDYFPDTHVVQEAISRMGSGCNIAAFNIVFGKEKKECRSNAFGPWLNFKTSLHHPGVFCHKRLFEKLGGFDESYKIAMDYEFWLRAYREGIRADTFDYVLTCMRDTGISSRSDWPSLQQRFLEEQHIHYQHLSSPGMWLIYKIYWSLYLPYRRIKSWTDQLRT